MIAELLSDFTLTDWIGVLGSALICSAYAGASFGLANPERVPFQVVNLTGAALLLLSLYYRPNPGAILIEAVWALIALAALARILRRRRSGVAGRRDRR